MVFWFSRKEELLVMPAIQLEDSDGNAKRHTERHSRPPTKPQMTSLQLVNARDAHLLRDLLSQHGLNCSQNVSCLGSDETMTSRRQGAQKFPRAQGEGSQKPKNIGTNCWFFGPVIPHPESWPYNHFLPRPFFPPLTRYLASKQKLSHDRCLMGKETRFIEPGPVYGLSHRDPTYLPFGTHIQCEPRPHFPLETGGSQRPDHLVAIEQD